MRERDVLETVLERRLSPEAADARRHAALGIAVETGLRTEGVVVHQNRARRGARQVETRVIGPEGAHRLRGRGRVARPRGGDGDRDRVSFEDGCPGARRPHRGRVRDDTALAEPPQDLRGLGRDLLLFLRNVGDQVVEDVEGDDARRPAGTGQPLHRGHQHALDAEGVEQRLQGDGEADGRAVGQR